MKTSTIIAALAALTVGALILEQTSEEAEQGEMRRRILLVDDGEGGLKAVDATGRPTGGQIPLMRVRVQDGYATYNYMQPKAEGWSVEDGSHTKAIIQNWEVVEDWPGGNEPRHRMILNLEAMGAVEAQSQ